ncbi:MAG: hypothetical protein HRU41_39775 [Saprospiraceae bacterium]|nr:hypothetical protein [Saprospiraceae bacterium]
MRKTWIHTFVSALTVLVCSACAQDDDRSLLIGSWTAYDVLEEGESLDINASEIKLDFIDEEVYSYKSTLDYQEAGQYTLQSSYLYTTDTLQDVQGVRKAVEIIQLTPDSLQLRMNDEGKERILKMMKDSISSSTPTIN